MKNLFSLIMKPGLAYLLLLSQAVSAQNHLSGRITDSVTHEPIPVASVFFASTTIGTSSDENGDYIIQNFKSGKYDLTVSIIGYKTVQLSIVFNDETKSIDIVLSPEILELPSFVVKADTTGWYANYLTFRASFLGQSKVAAACTILNPREINLYYDKDEGLLLAYAKEPIEIINKTLGYKISFQLTKFVIDYKNRTESYFGIARFEELPGINFRAVERERKRSFLGSFQHFIQAVDANALKENNFEVYGLFKVSDRISNEELNKHILALRKKITIAKETKAIRSLNDSINDLMALLRKPEFRDSLGEKITDTNILRKGEFEHEIIFPDRLRIVYKGAAEELAYSARTMKPRKPNQTTIIELLGKSIRIYSNGYYEEPGDVMLNGYMSWAGKAGDMLPWDYRTAMMTVSEQREVK